MANRKDASPDRPITLAGQTFTARFSIRATMALKDLWKLETEDQVQERLRNPKNQTEDFVDVLWASLRSHHPELSREQVFDLVDETGLEGLAENVERAISASQPPAPPPGQKKTVKAPR